MSSSTLALPEIAGSRFTHRPMPSRDAWGTALSEPEPDTAGDNLAVIKQWIQRFSFPPQYPYGCHVSMFCGPCICERSERTSSPEPDVAGLFPGGLLLIQAKEILTGVADLCGVHSPPVGGEEDRWEKFEEPLWDPAKHEAHMAIRQFYEQADADSDFR